MDAASHTGVDDVREIIEAVRYAAVSARYKVYIVDEVHMLSKNAFNALLKTLEEPPAHVKFLFATTEVNKVPVTVLSRCQRFDLRRIPAEALAAHFADVSPREGVEVEPEALALIARAAEGSARDGLSILDQAIAHGAGGSAPSRSGHARPLRPRRDPHCARPAARRRCAGALAALRDQYDLGVEPVGGASRPARERPRHHPGQGRRHRRSGPVGRGARCLRRMGSRLSFAAIHRLWQLLLKGLAEVHTRRCRSKPPRWRCCA